MHSCYITKRKARLLRLKVITILHEVCSLLMTERFRTDREGVKGKAGESSFCPLLLQFRCSRTRIFRQGGLSSAKTQSDAAAAKWASGTAQEAHLKQEGLNARAAAA